MQRFSNLIRHCVQLVAVGALASCGAMPSSGPQSAKILAASLHVVPPASEEDWPFALVDLSPQIAEALADEEYVGFVSSFAPTGEAPDLRIGVGDVVVVTIFEAASGGLFSGSPGTLGEAAKTVSLPPQVVARDGNISVPYAGQIEAAGRTPVEVQASIVAALREKAIEPQAIVTVTEPASTFVTITGEVGRGGRIPLSLGGDRILDVIASTGGPSGPAYETFVRVTRGSNTVTPSLAELVGNPSENIFVRPDDQIFVYRDPQTYTVLGASLQNRSLPFDAPRLTLAEAIGSTGGLADFRADPSGVFVFRYERPETFKRIANLGSGSGAVVHPAKLQELPSPSTHGLPVVYRLDLRDPSRFFAAQRFPMRDNDVVYISNAPITDVAKVLEVGRTAAGLALSAGDTVETFDRISAR